MTIRSLVVGGTSGIGYAMACRVAASTAATDTVLISGRTKPADLPHANMEFRPLDASSMRQIKHYTDALKSALPPPKLDLLIMTQGIMTTAPRTEVPGEGIDRKMAIHYYGKQLLIRELLPVLSESARVVIVYDGKLGSPSKLLWEDLDLKTHFTLGRAADHCISMMDAMVQWWAGATASRLGGRPHFVHAFPGGVNTNLLREVVPSYLQGVVRGLGNVFLTAPETCAQRLLDGAERCAVEGAKEGRFWSNIDSKGGLYRNKAVWSEEQLARVSEHTWKLVDATLQAEG
ncbi:hypothetical protein B0T24DRAFT_432534 [Lasiosphaeria ovina]|uniref:Uncharacterized protein n=1 Tax=Lasiosphaeria ovina TaxID=92902 RepID=A0AAE0JX72_9PEZI|nr:hypothetical protein B0T24DRAFT_107608 [Lasiosphaeria ovina]KAK3365371.1 hypothetical protein B0T24DRAFT_432534 [Lasiosphaeria ovina]